MHTETRHSVVLVIGTGVTTLLGMAYTVYAARVLGPAVAADFFAALSVVAFCSIALGPINGTVARFTAQFVSQEQYGRIRSLSTEVARRVALYGLFALVPALALAKPLATVLRFESVLPLIVAFGIIYLTLLLSVARGVLRGLQTFGKLNVNTIVESGVRLSIGCVLLGLWYGATAGLSAYLVALSVTLVVSYAQLRRVWQGHEPGRVDGRAIRRFTGPMFLLMLTSAGFQNVDMLFVKHYFVDVDAGVYGAAFSVARLISVIVTPFTTLTLPLLTTMYEQQKAIGATFLRVCGYFLVLAAVPVGLLALWPERIVFALFGEPYISASPLLLTLTAARLASYLCHMIGLASAATGSFRFLYVYLPSLAVQVVALLIWHGSLQTIVLVVLIIQSATVAALAGFLVGRIRQSPTLGKDGAPRA